MSRRNYQPNREDSDPSFSYENEGLLSVDDDDDLDDEFDRAQRPGTRDTGGGSSFWRTSIEGSSASSTQMAQTTQGAPQFSSVKQTPVQGVPQFPGINVQKYRSVSGSTLSSNGSHSAGSTEAPPRVASRLIASNRAHSHPNGSDDFPLGRIEQEGGIKISRSKSVSSDEVRPPIMHRPDLGNSSLSIGSLSRESSLTNKKEAARHLNASLRTNLETATGEEDTFHSVEQSEDGSQTQTVGLDVPDCAISRASTVGSDHSGSLLYGKPLSKKSAGDAGSATSGATSSGVLLGKSSSLIFPTGVETPGEEKEEVISTTRRKVDLLLDQCETVRFPFKKKLNLENLNLMATDVPVKDLCNTSLGNSLYKLSLAGNRLSYVPELLVKCMPLLKVLDMSQCDLHSLPDKWNLPQLKLLNLSHNRLTEFLDEGMLDGLRELQELNLYGNKVGEILVPSNPKMLSKLEILNLGYNDLSYLPDNLDQLKSLRVLKLMNNFLAKVPVRVCDMDLRTIDVSSNPVIQPPIETCERGISGMKRYYACLRLEEQSKQKALEEVQKKLSRQRNKKESAKHRKKRSFFSSGGSSQPLTPVVHAVDEERQLSKSMTSQNASRGDHVLPLSHGRRGVDELKGEEEMSKKSHPRAKLISSASAGPTLQRDGKSMSSDHLKKPRSISLEQQKPDRNNIFDSQKTTASSELSSSQYEFDSELESFHDRKTELLDEKDEATVNDTLKVIFVGMALAGKTSMIKRLIEGRDAIIPKRDERTVGVDIYEWDPKADVRKEIHDVDTKIEVQDDELASTCGDVNVKFSVWDFAGQHVYHATHELFFSPRALYVLVWDMGATNAATQKETNAGDNVRGAFKLGYDSSDEEDDDFVAEEAEKSADRALERDIDEKVQFWVDCIQSSAPGAAIMPVASFDDFFTKEGSQEEAKRRCEILKQRLLKHEKRRMKGLRNRLEEFEKQNRANDEAALRLRKLLCSYTRPKLIFGAKGEDSVVRVSGTKYTGFDRLTQKIVNIATGRDQAGWQYPIFRGHVGARIPRMRLEVREAVREMRDRFKVVEWGHFLSTLQKERGLYNAEDVSDALHFLTNIGELSYFGNVFTDRKQIRVQKDSNRRTSYFSGQNLKFHDEDEIGTEDEDNARLSAAAAALAETSTGRDDTSVTSGTSAGLTESGLSQFVFLNPRWLVAAVACILRHDLDREITDTRRRMLAATKGDRAVIDRGDSFVYDANLNCPVITAQDACMLWQAKKFTKKAAERAQLYSSQIPLTPFEFLQRLLIRFGVFVPMDLSIDKAYFGGKEYGLNSHADYPNPQELKLDMKASDSNGSPNFFFLPSLLGPGEPTEAWTYKNTDSWATTLCHSVLFPDGVPPGLMERVTSAVLSGVYAVAKTKGDGQVADGDIRAKEILCWRTAFFLKLGTLTRDNGEIKEGVTELFCLLADRESHLCVGSDYMGVGTRRLVLSAKGQVGDNGRKIWAGGYMLVMKAINRVMYEYGGLEYEKQGFCPECLSKKAVSQASSWDWSTLRSASKNGDETVRCHHGHRVNTGLVTGPSDTLPNRLDSLSNTRFNGLDPIVPVSELLRGVVLVGLWDGRSRKVVRVGSGFVADRKRGLIVTASHTLMNIWGDKRAPFGENYYGLRDGKVVIGIIRRKKGTDANGSSDGTMAVFRYFAKIVAKDESIESKGECHLDACVLRITTRMENDVEGDGEGCGDQPETLLLNNPDALKREKLHQLKVAETCELDEQVRILGYNQGGEGLLDRGENLNRYVDFARGYVCKKFGTGEEVPSSEQRHKFKPRAEIVVICPTIGGHSGGPCVNQQGEVIGILSRADPAEKQRCYLVPAYEWKSLVKKAKNTF